MKKGVGLFLVVLLTIVLVSCSFLSAGWFSDIFGKLTGKAIQLEANFTYFGVTNYQWGFAGANSVSGDYDGDGKADLAVWNPTDGKWYAYSIIKKSNLVYGVAWGANGMIPVSGDYDGDKKSDLALWNPTDGKWYVRDAANTKNIVYGVSWGTKGMIPVSGDYDGDGKSDLALWNPSEGKWYIRNAANTQNIAYGIAFGSNGMIPVSGDYDGDGKSDLALWNPTDGKWYVRDAANTKNIVWAKAFGANGMIPVSGDYDGDGRSDLALYGNAAPQWYIYSVAKQENILWNKGWGSNMFTPVSGDYTGDGIYDIALYNGAIAGWQWEVYPLYVPSTTPVTCTSFTYSAYNTCNSSGIQTRTVLTSSPNGCTGGNPVTSRACNYVPPTTPCTSFTYSAWSACNSSEMQTRTIGTALPSGCSGGSPVLSQSCSVGSCTDSDGGLNYYTAGNITSGNMVSGPSYDFCTDSVGLRETFCSSNVGTPQLYNCPNGCSNGACNMPNQTSSSCTDSDGGLNYNLRGILVNSEGNFEDSCSNDGLWENYCDSVGNSLVVNYSCPNGCSNGACINASVPQEPTCTDSDGGLDYYVKGQTSDGAGNTYQDSCPGDDIVLNEAFCDDDGVEVKIEEYSCPNGCSDGACVVGEKPCVSRYVCGVTPNICPSSGIQIKRCEDFECQGSTSTEEVKCNPGECSGCQLEEKCIPYGFRTQVTLYNNNPGTFNLYCEVDGQLREQRTKDPSTGNWAVCQNNYECESNLCSKAQCVEILDMTDNAGILKSVFVKTICKIAHLLSTENYNQCIVNYLEPTEEPVA